jgi:K+-transporting ATPase A subunit
MNTAISFATTAWQAYGGETTMSYVSQIVGLAAITTSNGATGSYNSMHDSYTPLGGAVPLVNMLLGEMIFGGLGTGFYSIVLIALISLFIAGLMVGRTPEYLGKQIDPPEVKLIGLYTSIGPVTILLLTALIVGGLSYFPALAIGPIVEQLLLGK